MEMDIFPWLRTMGFYHHFLWSDRHVLPEHLQNWHQWLRKFESICFQYLMHILTKLSIFSRSWFHNSTPRGGNPLMSAWRLLGPGLENEGVIFSSCMNQNSSHRCRNSQIFGGAKEFCPGSPKLARKTLQSKSPPEKSSSCYFGRHYF